MTARRLFLTLMLGVAIGLLVVLCRTTVSSPVACGFAIYFVLCVAAGILDHAGHV